VQRAIIAALLEHDQGIGLTTKNIANYVYGGYPPSEDAQRATRRAVAGLVAERVVVQHRETYRRYPKRWRLRKDAALDVAFFLGTEAEAGAWAGLKAKHKIKT
jgi:hypothetical protein